MINTQKCDRVNLGLEGTRTVDGGGKYKSTRINIHAIFRRPSRSSPQRDVILVIDVWRGLDAAEPALCLVEL